MTHCLNLAKIAVLIALVVATVAVIGVGKRHAICERSTIEVYQC